MNALQPIKLSQRLTALYQGIPKNQFHQIWDCCCDHGYLGQKLMTEHVKSHIHLVDVVPHLIDEISNRFKTLDYIQESQYSLHCMDAAAIRLDDTLDNLVIISGVGGDLLIEMVKAIVSNHPSLVATGSVSFLLCPVRQLHKVREGLNTLCLGLVEEKIVKDKQLFYEVIMVSNQSKTNVSPVGDNMWNLKNKDHVEYRDTMIKHYSKQPSEYAKSLLALYQNIT